MTNSTRTLLLAAALLGLVTSALAQTATLNGKVVKFCKNNLGKEVGSGECYDLAAAALQYADAKPQNGSEDSPNAGDYVWGKLVYALETTDGSQKETKVPKMSVQPGDVIQFRDAKFEGKNLRGFETYFTIFPHHTAVVSEVGKADEVLTALEQNVNDKRVVTANAYRLSDLKTGWVRVYRPVPK